MRRREGAVTGIRYDVYLSEARSRVKVLLEHSVLLVFLCTLIGAAAQILLKVGANQLASSNPLKMLLNPWLFCGYALYGMSTMLLILALRKGQLSVLYPVIALTYVWVDDSLHHDLPGIYECLQGFRFVGGRGRCRCV